jgi:hypothetical protein
MANNLPSNNNQPPATSTDTPPATIPETSSVVLPEEPKTETPTEKPAEPTIEIDSLGQPSLSTLQEASSKTSNKSKKMKTVVSILGLLLIIASLPLAVILVKQRQEIRKEAEMGQGVVEKDGIQISAISEQPPTTANGGTYSTTFKIKNTNSGTKTVVLEKHQCACVEGGGNPSGKCFNHGQPGCPAPQTETITLGGGQSIERTVSARQPDGSVCGSFQVDLVILSVN